MTLAERLKTDCHKGFKPGVRYYSVGDFVTFFRTQERCFAQRLDGLVTVYIGAMSGDLVGYKVQGVSSSQATGYSPVEGTI